MVRIFRWNKDKKKSYSWDTSKGGSGISPTNASSNSSTIEKTKAYLDEKERDKLLKQMMANRKTEIGKDVILGQPFRGNIFIKKGETMVRGGGSGAPINFVKAQEDASKVRTEIREGAMPMDTSKKVDEMMKNATIEREDEKEKENGNQQWQSKFLGAGVYIPNVDKVEEKKDFVKAEEEQIEKERDNMKKQGVDKTATKEPYVSYGSSHPDRPQTLTDELKQLKNLGRWQRENIPSRVPEEMTDDDGSGNAEVNDEGVYGMNIPIIDEKTKKQKMKIINGIEVPQFAPAKLLVFNFRNKKGEEFQMPVYADSKQVGKHVKVFSIDGDKIPKSSGKGQKEFGDTTNIQSFNYSRVRETIAILSEKAGFEPVNWNLQNIKANQAGQIIRNLLEVSEIIDSKGKKL